MSVRATLSTIAARRHRAAGFTLIELIIVIVLISVIAVAGADRLFYYQERAEKAVMDETLASFKMGLQIRSAELAIANRQGATAELERENPVRWLDTPPANYGGDYRTPTERGKWYFAPATEELVYVPNNTAYLKLPDGAAAELRFKIRLRYDVIDTVSGNSRVPAGISIVPLTEYKWF